MSTPSLKTSVHQEFEEIIQQGFVRRTRAERQVFLETLIRHCDADDVHLLQKVLEEQAGHQKIDLLASLPTELSTAILRHVGVSGVGTCRRVCKKWLSRTRDPSLWRSLLLQTGTAHTFHQENVEATATNPVDWEAQTRYSLQSERAWRSASPTRITNLRGHTDRVYALRLKGNILISGSYDRTVRVWDLCPSPKQRRFCAETGRVSDVTECTRTLQSHTVTCLDFLTGKHPILAIGYYEGECHIWNYRTGKLLNRLKGHVAAIVCLCINDKFVVTSCKDRHIAVWSWQKGEMIWAFTAHDSPMVGIAIIPNISQQPSLISCSRDGFVQSHDITTRKSTLLQLFEPDEDFPGKTLQCMADGLDRVICATNSGTLYEVGYQGANGNLRCLRQQSALLPTSANRTAHVNVDCIAAQGSDFRASRGEREIPTVPLLPRIVVSEGFPALSLYILSPDHSAEGSVAGPGYVAAYCNSLRPLLRKDISALQVDAERVVVECYNGALYVLEFGGNSFRNLA